MLLRLLPIVILTLAFSGCATSQMKAQNDQLEQRLTNVEKDLQAKDAEIVDLQYQVKDISGKVETSQPAGSVQPSQEASESAGQAESAPEVEVSSGGQILRVHVNAEKVQRALKSAGVYTGPVDGKIGPGTKEAIIEFQKSHGLRADGVLGRKTWEELKTYLNNQA